MCGIDVTYLTTRKASLSPRLDIILGKDPLTGQVGQQMENRLARQQLLHKWSMTVRDFSVCSASLRLHPHLVYIHSTI